MRKFIISDLHGNGNIYYSVMNYLDNLANREEIVLYVNGDLIDRGPDSVEMLLDMKRRIKDGPFKIIYLAGNHELMMYQMYLKRIKGLNTYKDIWFINGGIATDKELDRRFNSKEDILEIVDFISNLKIYHKFKEKINNKPIVLVHAACPIDVEDECNIRIKDNTSLIEWAVWTREIDPFIPFRCRIGNDKYFSIVGHTPNNNKYGYEYHERENYLNIDGGCSQYVCGLLDYDHVPLVEIKDNYLRILTFNNNDEIIYGNNFDGSKDIELDSSELEEDRYYLSKK